MAVNLWARGWSLIPRAPASRQRRASSIGVSFRSRRTNGISRPSLRAANASVRLLAALKAGWRSGSSRQNMNAREMPYLRHQRLELVVVADHAVDVVPEVEVGVEDVRPAGQQLAQFGVVALDQRLCSVARLHQLDPS